MITTTDEFLSAAYVREQIDRLPLADAEIADMTRLVATSDMKARLVTLEGIPEGRDHISAVYRRLLHRAIAAR